MPLLNLVMRLPFSLSALILDSGVFRNMVMSSFRLLASSILKEALQENPSTAAHSYRESAGLGGELRGLTSFP